MTDSQTTRNTTRPLQVRPPGRRAAWAIGGVVAAALLLSQSLKVIPAGYVGVVFSAFSGVKSGVRQEGIHLLMPFVDRVNLYDARLQEVTLAHNINDGDEGAIRARSQEGLDITADVTVQFRIDRAKAAILHKELGRNYLQTVIRPQVRSKVRDAIGQFSAADLISTQRQAVEASITTALRQVFERNNLVLDSVLLRELRIPDSVAKAIEQKQTAEQQVAVEKNRLQQANISAQRAVVEAEGAAKASVAKARGEAEALSLRGRALRENPQLIQLTVAEKLSPGIQTVMLPSDGNFLLDVANLTKPKTGN
ncbi:prohibitin family protein [Deinococcus sp. HMF7620]|uniref:Prohibitin family protein n=1 Tax=Deinococcus arboris TaxID=2682977 RepID=A0A7C9I1I7_9DEIO|nr:MULTISPECIES: prohibitin family protein [Deinococcus]MBZ9749256.1 prohibitin family protein [Deinococcus betulae]MVN88655.1 prohibitin family protein [Deinococcus arboris]